MTNTEKEIKKVLKSNGYNYRISTRRWIVYQIYNEQENKLNDWIGKETIELIKDELQPYRKIKKVNCG